MVALPHRSDPPCPACGMRRGGAGKIIRWATNLSGTQVIDLIARLSAATARAGTDPAPVREALIRFVRGLPP